jgi:hypothetical protein
MMTDIELINRKFAAWFYTWDDFHQEFETRIKQTMTTEPTIPAEKPKKKQVDWEGKLAEQIAEAGLPLPIRQFKGIPDRKFSFDFAWPMLMIAAECEGGSWGGSGRHTSGAGYKADCMKYNLATRHGWQVYRFTSDQVKDKTAIEFIKEVFKREVQKILQEEK